jgi:hypothetical protein
MCTTLCSKTEHSVLLYIGKEQTDCHIVQGQNLSTVYITTWPLSAEVVHGFGLLRSDAASLGKRFLEFCRTMCMKNAFFTDPDSQNMKMTCCIETSGTTMPCHIPEDQNPRSHHCKNLKTHTDMAYSVIKCHFIVKYHLKIHLNIATIHHGTASIHDTNNFQIIYSMHFAWY